MNQLVIDKIKLRLPNKLDELSKLQLRKIWGVKNLEIQSWQLNNFLFITLIGRNVKLWFFLAYNVHLVPVLDFLTFGQLSWRQKLISSDDWHDLAELYSSFLWDKHQNLTKNPFPWIKSGLRWLKGPQDKFADLTYGEFIKADEFFLVYQATQKIEYLDKMIAVLWRRGFKRRQRFDLMKFSKRLQIIQKLSSIDKELILLWYVGCRKILEGEYKNLYPKSGEEPANQLMHLKNIQQYAKSMSKKVFDYAQTPGDVDVQKIYEANLYSVLRKIDQEIADYKKLTEE